MAEQVSTVALYISDRTQEWWLFADFRKCYWGFRIAI